MRKQWNILSTRPFDERQLDVVVANDYVFDHIGFISVLPVQSQKLQNRINELLQLRLSVIFTSMNAVELLALQLRGAKPAWDIYCIGQTTQKLVSEIFGEQLIMGFAPNAAALADLIIAGNPTLPLVFFCGDRRRVELPLKLNAAGLAAEEVIVYHTVNTPVKLEKLYDAVLFYSPSAVQSFFEANAAQQNTTYFAIGDTTATELRNHTANIVVANEAGKQAMMTTVTEFFMKERI